MCQLFIRLGRLNSKSRINSIESRFALLRTPFNSVNLIENIGSLVRVEHTARVQPGGGARRVLRLCPTVLCRAIRLSLLGQCPYRPEPRRSGGGRATIGPWPLLTGPRVLLADDWRPRRTTSCRKCNRTRCRRKYAIGWRPRSPDRWRARGARATTSPSSSRWRTPSGPAYSWTACTAGWSPRRWWRSPPTWSKYSRSVPSPSPVFLSFPPPCCCPLPPPVTPLRVHSVYFL